jgi:hypothetical protein
MERPAPVRILPFDFFSGSATKTFFTPDKHSRKIGYCDKELGSTAIMVVGCEYGLCNKISLKPGTGTKSPCLAPEELDIKVD